MFNEFILFKYSWENTEKYIFIKHYDTGLSTTAVSGQLEMAE